jgi:hypothetical protein
MSYILRKPQIQPSHIYKLMLQSKNCGLLSDGDSAVLVVMAASMPAQPGMPYVLSYDSATTMTVIWEQPESNGGHPVTSYNLYLDDNVLVSLNPSLNYYTLNSLTLG